jgi:hypothetical protein
LSLSSDDIGDRGQAIFIVLITELCGRNEPFFRPRFLGGKFPTFDFVVELVDRPAYYFFVQVKTTTQGFTQDPVKLKVQVPQKDIDRMVAFPAPTYFVGIDEPNRIGYLLSINEPRERVASLITDFKIDCAVLEQLAHEVREFWASRDMVLAGSKFKE